MEENTTDIDNINKYFKLPIYYNDKKNNLKENIINDLELVNVADPSYNPMYSFLFNNDNILSKKITEQVSEYYTTDTNFLKDSQTLLKTYKKTSKYFYHVLNILYSL